MATQFVGSGTFVANSTITAYLGVVLSNNRGVGLSTTTAIDAIALVDGASGDQVSVAFLTNNGTLKGVITAVPVTVGDTLFLGATGYLSTTGTITIGKSLTTATSNGSVIEFIPKNV